MSTENELHIAAVQFDIAWLDAKENFKRIEYLLNQHSFEQTELLLLPETFSSGFAVETPESGEIHSAETVCPSLLWMQKISQKLDVIIAGSVLVKTEAKKNNRFFWVWPNGDYQFYDKKHLFTPAKEDLYIAPGNERKIINIKNFRILPQVCYDLRFPVWSRNLGDYDVMINVANWPLPRRDHWSSLLKARAIENQAYVIGVNRIGTDGKNNSYNGGTACFSFDGSEVSSIENNQANVTFCSLSKTDLETYRTQLPFYKDADNFTLQR